MAEETPSKRARSSKDVPYELIYWPGLPGRGEFIRLVLEEAGATYTDTAQLPGDDGGGAASVLPYLQGTLPPASDPSNTPLFAPPILKHGDLLINQTPNILLYLGLRHGLVPGLQDDPDAQFRVNGLALTALDGLCNEPHDCHHPVATGLYYEDQKAESRRRAEDFVKERLPKFLGYFERVLGSAASGDAPWLYGGEMSYADLVLFQVRDIPFIPLRLGTGRDADGVQCVDGVKFMFPKAMAKLEREGKCTKVLALWEAVKERPRIKAYLGSERRQKYSNGIYRYYEELDLEG